MRACHWPGPHSSSRPLHCPLGFTSSYNPAPQLPFTPTPTPSPSLHTAKKRPWRAEIPGSLPKGYETLLWPQGIHAHNGDAMLPLPEYPASGRKQEELPRAPVQP